MLLNVSIIGQRDARWASQRLGTVNGTTIGGYGCVITCMAMLATYYGHPITPDKEDDWLTDHQGYLQGNLYRNDAFSREFSDCAFDKVISCTNIPAPLGEIDNYLNVGKPVVVMVDFDHDPNDGIQTHFVLLVGKDKDKYICNDPWYADQVVFDDRYGKADASINQINFFSGPVPQISLPVPQPQLNPDEIEVVRKMESYRKSADNLDGEDKDLLTFTDRLVIRDQKWSPMASQLSVVQNQLQVCLSKPAVITSTTTPIPTTTTYPLITLANFSFNDIATELFKRVLGR